MNVKEFIRNNGYEDKVKTCFYQIDESQKKMNDCMCRYDSKGYESASVEKQKADFELSMVFLRYSEEMQNRGQLAENSKAFMQEARSAVM